MVPPGFHHVAIQWGIWRAGGIAVPLAVSHPPAELEHVIRDCDAEIVLAHPEFESTLRSIEPARRHASTATAVTSAPRSPLPAPQPGRRAMIVYTSGTTGKPKGAVTTHGGLQAQVESLVAAWEWVAEDRILLILPLHHVHGIVNVLTCALWAGALCDMLPKFDAAKVWSRITEGNLTVFMAVPTIYQRLIGAWDAATPEQRVKMSGGCAKMRLMVSGSAALPVSTLERWREISGHTLLERYGMTEIGMALSNPLRGERRPGTVGMPLPGVEVRLSGEGEIEVKGATVFLEYWGKPAETKAAFRDGWFRTGDVAVIESGYYRILGRSSTDIIKTGGYKVSALEIEEVLRTHPLIAECAVVGVSDAEWGERICAAVELRGGELGLTELQAWAKERLAPYKVPRSLSCVVSLPRNAMGKVVKPDLAVWFRDR